MKMRSSVPAFLIMILVIVSCQSSVKDHKDLVLDQDTIIYWNDYKSEFVKPRNVEIWLPDNYGKDPEQYYRLVLMQDGQNVFNPATSFTGIAWGADHLMDSLIKMNLVVPTIVVAVWNTNLRMREYLPVLEDKNGNPETLKEDFLKEYELDKLPKDETVILSNAYLKFLVNELLPDLRANFKISKDRKDITIMGSSAGALLAFKAFCKYPEVFGNAGCLSTHWPVKGGYAESLQHFIPEWLPAPDNRRIYFDFGSLGLDAQYKPWQAKVDKLLQQKGYIRGKNYLTIEAVGADHNEASWKARLHKPFQFLQRK